MIVATSLMVPTRVAGIADRHQLGLRGDERLEVLHVQRAALQVDIHPAHLGARCLRRP